MSKTRQPVKALNKSTAAIQADAAAEKARKAASRKALRDAKKQQAEAAAIDAELEQADKADTKEVLANIDAAEQERKQAENDAAYKQALRVDYDALIESGELDASTTFEAYLAEQTATPEKQRYSGPMLALVSARRSYVKADNGILCNGDALATLCGMYKREVVCKGLVQALGLGGNPYLALNEGQQSMNLRNRTRHALKNGTVTMVQVADALKAAYEG